MTDQLHYKQRHRGVSGLLPRGEGCKANTCVVHDRHGAGAADWSACGGGSIQ
jgi:hypothetical protein